MPAESTHESDARWMARALELAASGQGRVEPNPMVGCVLVEKGAIVAEGWHRQFGGPHAEIEALKQAGSRSLAHATMYVTLEPCSHHGKTPPCIDDIILSQLPRVVVAMPDPFPQVQGKGIARLREVGIQVDIGCLEIEARKLNAPYLHLLATGRPWVIAKWAISLDGLIATRTGESRWISGELSRGVVHLIRGRVDGIVVGRRTLQADDPLLTARPAGPRVATRIVYAGSGSVPLTCQLVQTASRIPTLLVVDQSCLRPAHAELEQHGCEVLSIESLRSREGLLHSLRVLGARGMTNLLLEGGSGLLGAFFDAGAVNEVHVFVAPKVIGGAGGTSAVGGLGISHLAESWGLGSCAWEPLGEDIYIHGTVAKSGSNPG